MFHDVETYIDDILIYAPTEEEHDRRLRVVLQRCRDANLSLNKDKCVIKTQELKYLFIDNITGRGQGRSG